MIKGAYILTLEGELQSLDWNKDYVFINGEEIWRRNKAEAEELEVMEAELKEYERHIAEGIDDAYAQYEQYKEAEEDAKDIASMMGVKKLLTNRVTKK
jgi:hypothetical protein